MTASSLADGVRFTPTAGGTTDWTYSAFVVGYNSPAQANMVNGAQYTYRAESADLSQWEFGQGNYNSSTGVIARTTILYSYTGGTLGTSKVSFSAAPQVAIVALKEDIVSGAASANQTAVFSDTNTATGVGPGSVGQALISNGSGNNPSYQAGPWTLLSTLTASSSASLTDTTHITGSYNDYEIVLENLIPASSGVTCQLQVFVAGVLQTSGYLGAYIQVQSGSVAGGSATAFVPVNATNAVPNSSPGVSGRFMLFGPVSTTTNIKIIDGGSVTLFSGVALKVSSGGYLNSTSAINGISISFSSGNITSGTVKIYGRN